MIYFSIIGSFLLAACGAPLAFEAFQKGSSDISLPFTFMWLFGEIFVAIYVIYKKEKALTINYLANIFFILIVLFYRFFPREVL